MAINEKFGLHFAKLGPDPACMTNARLNLVRPSATAEVRFLLAGYAADKIFAPTQARRENLENEFDFARALEIVEEEHLQILLRETERIVAGRWPQVTAVAQALLQRGRLEALEIYRVIVKAR